MSKGEEVPSGFACSTRSLITCISALQPAGAGEILLHRHYSHLACSFITTQLQLLVFGLPAHYGVEDS